MGNEQQCEPSARHNASSVSSAQLCDELPCVEKPERFEDVNEAGYLDANLDAKRAGISAHDHFVKCGQSEGRLQWVNTAEVERMRERKLAAIAFRRPPETARSFGQAPNFLSRDVIEEFDLPESPPISDHHYGPPLVELLRSNRDKLFLDLGAGLRHTYHSNVINTDIYPWVSTDVVCVGEDLPFADEQFDYIFCFAVLEHTRRPWQVAGEMCRVLKPGGTLLVDYPFMQPVHGYPHHYFNATPQGAASLFEDACEIKSVEVNWNHHPIISLYWILTVWRNGLPTAAAEKFLRMTVKDLLAAPAAEQMEEFYCRELHPMMQKAIASGSMVVAQKRQSSATPAITRDSGSGLASVEVRSDQPNPAAALSVDGGDDIDSLRRTVASLRRRNESLRDTLSIIHSSTSWRVTAPMRALARVFGRGRA